MLGSSSAYRARPETDAQR